MSIVANISAALIVAAAIFRPSIQVRAAPSLDRSTGRPSFARQANVRSATTFAFLPFPSTLYSEVGNFVFTPDGTAYFTDSQNAIASFTPTGVLTQLAVPNATVSSSLIYARGRLWMFGYPLGVISVRPDGSGRRWYQFTSPNTFVDVRQMTYGPDGDIYIIASMDNQNGTDQTYPLFRIDANGIVTTVTHLPVAPLNAYGGSPSIVFGTDGLLYFGYGNPATRAFGIARLESSGSVTLFPIGQVSSLIASRGNIYFLGPGAGLGRLTPAGAVTYSAFPATGNIYPSALSVDKGGTCGKTLTVIR